MARIDDPNPKMQLPDAWAEKMVCPVCGSRPLGVFHPTGQADRFACAACETSFELEDGGTRIRFVTLPPRVTPWLRTQWVILEEALAAFETEKKSNKETNIPLVDHSNIPAEPDKQLPPSPVFVESLPVESKTQIPVEPTQPIQVTQKPVNKPETDQAPGSASSPSPFYEEDFNVPGIFPVQPPAETKEPASELWKDREEQRVIDAINNPPVYDFAGQLAKNEPQQVDSYPESKTVKESILEKAVKPNDTVLRTDSPQAASVTGQSKETQTPVKSLSLDNPPPVNPLEDTPPVVIHAPRMRPNTIFNAPGEDLGDLRSHILGASYSPTLKERIETATQRAIELHGLGNSDQEVRSILERASGLTPEQVADVLKSLEKPEEKKQSSRVILLFSILAMAIFTLLAWLFFTNQAVQIKDTNTNNSGGLLPGQIVDPTILPPALQTLMPNGIHIFNEPPSVEVSTADKIPAATCPTSKIAAAELFGGPADDWNADVQARGWALISEVQGLEIKIPANMTGGYLVFERGPEIKGVTGPAIVHNIYMISVSCE